MVDTRQEDIGRKGLALLLSVEGGHNRPMIRPNPPVRCGQDIRLVLHPFLFHAGADQDVIEAANWLHRCLSGVNRRHHYSND